MEQLIKNFIKYLKYVEMAFLVLWVMVAAKIAESFDGVFNQVFTIVTIALALIYYFGAMSGKPKAEQGDNPAKVVRPKLAFLSLTVLCVGILFRVKAYPDASIMLLVGSVTLVVVLLLYLLTKDDDIIKEEFTEDPEVVKLFSRNTMLIRVAVAVAIGFFMMVQGSKNIPYTAKNNLIDALTSIEKPLSQRDATIVAAWWDINCGFEKEKVLNAYQITESELALGEKLAFEGNSIPQDRKVEIIGDYAYAPNRIENLVIEEFLSASDFEYIKSLRSIVYKATYRDDIKVAYDLNNIIQHTDNQEFIIFVKDNYSVVLDLLKTDVF